MPLNFQLFPISFASGLDTKTDRKQVIPGKLLQLENGHFTKPGSIVKRYGLDLLSKIVTGSDAITKGAALATYRDELLMFDGERVYSRLPAIETWADRGQVASPILDTRNVLFNSYEQKNPDLAINGELEVYAWEDSRGGIRYSLLDADSGAFLISDQEVTASGSAPKTIAVGNHLLVFFLDGASVKYRSINIAAPHVLNPEVVASANLNATYRRYDVVQNGGSVFLVFGNNASGTSLMSIDANLEASAETTTSGLPTSCITLFADANQNVWVAYHDGSAVKLYVRSFTFSSVLEPVTVETLADVLRITGVSTDEATGEATLFYEVSAALTFNHLIRTNTVKTDGTVGTASVFIRSFGLASKAYRYDDATYLTATYESPTQSKYITLDGDANEVAVIANDIGGGLRSNATVAEVNQSGSTFKVAVSQKGRILSENNRIFSLLGVVSAALDFESPNRFLTAEIGESLFTVGATVQSYDGIGFGEHGYRFYPESSGISVLGNEAPTVTDGYLGTGQYGYVFVFEWTDNNGRIHRSRPSEPIFIEFASGTSNWTRITVPTLRLTKKTGARDDVRICIYRTEANGTSYYRASSVTEPFKNDPTVDTLATIDKLSDDDLISRERLYTDGGILENDPPPPAKFIATNRNRVFLAGVPSDPNLLWFSQMLVEGEPIAFSEFLTLKCDPRGGDITALSVMDDHLIIFKEKAIFRLSGEGPNNLGDPNSNDYGNPVLITTDVGCTNPNSIATTPNGIVFQSAKGIILLDRSFQVSYLGAPVEAFNDLTISSSVVIPDQNLILFTTATDVALVYDYFTGQWGTYTNHQAEDAVLWRNSYVFVRSDGTVCQQNKTKFTDGSSFIPLTISTSYIGLAGLLGYQSVTHVGVLGEFKGPHKLQISVSYDFNENYADQYTPDAAQIFGSNNWGSSATWGSDSVWGGYYSPYQFIAHLTRQQCQNIRITISDKQSSGYNEGYSISGVTLRVGLKPGLARVPRANKVP